ncbi:hypothetical protein ACFE04_031977 [Oxalis oulophora]
MAQNQATPTYHPSLSTADSAFPTLAIAVLSVTATAVLLISYYVIVNKCLHQSNLLRRFSIFRAREQNEDPFIAFSPSTWMNRGLEDSVVREIPTFQFKRGEECQVTSFNGCVVCLNEFKEHDMLRVLPSCAHAFHVDCIDIWFQSNDNCPLCRSSISGNRRYPIDQIIAPSSSPQNSLPHSGSLISNDEDFVVIELGLENRQQERRVLAQTKHSRSWSSQKFENKLLESKRRKKRNHYVSIMGDECIDIRVKDEAFTAQPLRRSFSLDSAADRQLYLTVRQILRRNEQKSETSNAQESHSNIVRRSLFSLGHDRLSKNAVLHVEIEL